MDNNNYCDCWFTISVSRPFFLEKKVCHRYVPPTTTKPKPYPLSTSKANNQPPQTESISIKTTYPNEKATKIVIDLMQMVIKLWGIEKPINTNPLIDNLNSNKDN